MDQFGYGILYTLQVILILALVYLAVWQPKGRGKGKAD